MPAFGATSSNLNGLVMLNPNNGWAVGNAGTILHYDGSSWNQIPSGTTTDIYGISFGPPNGLNPNAGLAVGGSAGGSVALAWSGLAWTTATSGLSPSAAKLTSVFLESSSEGWAVDDSGGIWHWSGLVGLGGGWSLASSAIYGLKSIFMTSVTEGWAVGVNGVIYHYSSGGWTLSSTVGITLNSVFMLTSTEGWAVGNGGRIYHYLSGIWTGPISPSSTSNDLRSVFMISQAEGWAVGAAGVILHLLNGIWTLMSPSPTSQNLNSVYLSGSVGWAVGDLGTVITIGGPVSQGNPATSLQSVFLLSQNNGWVAGCSTGGCNSGTGEPVMVHWDGLGVTRAIVIAPTIDLYSVFMSSSSNGWSVGGIGASPIILHYTGGSWTQVTAPSSGYILRSVFMTDSNNGWAVGDGGTILHYVGGSWTIASSPTTSALRSVFMVGSSDGCAVGDSGTIVRYQGSSGHWFAVPSPTGARLNSVFLLDPSHGWAVGVGGTILHYDGNIWTTVAGFVSTDLNSVFQTDPQEAWAVGNSATILHWTGISWYPYTPIPPLTGTSDLKSVYMLTSAFGLIVGAPPTPGSQATIYPIPEFDGPPILTLVSFTVMLLVLSTRQHKRKVRIEN